MHAVILQKFGSTVVKISDRSRSQLDQPFRPSANDDSAIDDELPAERVIEYSAILLLFLGSTIV